MKQYKKLSIDAWADIETSWTWNNWFTLGYEEKLPETLNDFAEMLGGYTGEGNIEDHYELYDDGYNIVLIHRWDNGKDTAGKPCYAVEYGSHY